MSGVYVRLAALLLPLLGLACARANPSYEDGYDMSYPGGRDAGSDRAVVQDARPADAPAPADAASGGGPEAWRDVQPDAPTAQTKVVSGLLGYWRFEDAPGTTVVADSSGNGRHGTLQGLNPSQAWAPGRMGQGLAVTSTIPNAGVEIRADAAIDGLRAFTISLWLRRNEATAMTQRSMFSRQFGTTSNEVFNLSCSFSNVVVYVPGTGSQVNFESRWSGPTAANTWIHAAGTYDGRWLRLWINGNMVAENNFVDRLVSSTTPVYIGTNKNPNRSEPFDGTLDEVALFDRALDQAAIRLLAGGASVFDLP